MATSATHPTLELTPGHVVDRIVVPVTLEERHDRGVSAAAELAERFRLPVHLISVEVGAADAVSIVRETAMHAAVDAILAARPSVTVTHELLAATEHPAAAFAAELDAADLAVLATSALDGPAGSFAQESVGHTSNPVLMFGPNAPATLSIGDVIVGLDGSVLSERIVPAARGFAAALGANVKLTQVVAPAVSSHVQRLRARGQNVAENAYLRDLWARLDDPSVSWEVIHHDDPAVALAAAVDAGHPAVLALATHGREGFVAHVFGSIAISTVRRASCPVLIQRPVGDDIDLTELS